jgi:hypothetical protein
MVNMKLMLKMAEIVVIIVMGFYDNC